MFIINRLHFCQSRSDLLFIVKFITYLTYSQATAKTIANAISFYDLNNFLCISLVNYSPTHAWYSSALYPVVLSSIEMEYMDFCAEALEIWFGMILINYMIK